MYNLKVIQHADMTNNELNQIIKIKSVVWPYPYEKQLEWLNTNLKESDLHLILLKNNNTVAYLNLIDIELEIDKKLFNAFGVGNVCAIEKGKGYGNILMKNTNQYIIEKKRVGLLFCKKKLVDFYEKFDWIWVDKKKMALTFDNSNIETMIFSNTKINSVLVFKEKPF
jgi:predicted GNAT family N-acyltransferase